MNRSDLSEYLPKAVEKLVQSVLAEPEMQHLNRVLLPDRDVIIEIIKRLRQLIFPGYFGKPGLNRENIAERLLEVLEETTGMLYEQVRCCLRFRRQLPGAASSGALCEECDSDAAKFVAAFLDRLPAVREMISFDLKAHFDGDPAAQSPDETIFCYPGLFAIVVQRVAHEFYKMDVPMLPRIMTEYAHSITGIDIHPGAKLGKRLFIDHGTGVVIGETTEIGDNVKIYQGVTLGALAPAFGQLLRGRKRHPTIENDVTIYAGATILGGDTIIGRGALIGGNVFLTRSVPALNQVTAEAPNLKYRKRPSREEKNAEYLDFQI
jgi:serine O-acetyltransferase